MKIIEAVKDGNLNRVKELLFNNSTIVNDKNAKGKTALFFAIDNQDILMVELLLKAGAYVNIKDDYGQTPMHYAASNARYGIMKLLIENKAEINTPDKKNRTPIFFVFSNIGDGILNDERKEMLLLLARNGVDYNIKDFEDKTPMIFFDYLNGDLSGFKKKFIKEVKKANKNASLKQENKPFLKFKIFERLGFYKLKNSDSSKRNSSRLKSGLQKKKKGPSR